MRDVELCRPEFVKQSCYKAADQMLSMLDSAALRAAQRLVAPPERVCKPSLHPNMSSLQLLSLNRSSWHSSKVFIWNLQKGHCIACAKPSLRPRIPAFITDLTFKAFRWHRRVVAPTADASEACLESRIQSAVIMAAFTNRDQLPFESLLRLQEG